MSSDHLTIHLGETTQKTLTALADALVTAAREPAARQTPTAAPWPELVGDGWRVITVDRPVDSRLAKRIRWALKWAFRSEPLTLVAEPGEVPGYAATAIGGAVLFQDGIPPETIRELVDAMSARETHAWKR